MLKHAPEAREIINWEKAAFRKLAQIAVSKKPLFDTLEWEFTLTFASLIRPNSSNGLKNTTDYWLPEHTIIPDGYASIISLWPIKDGNICEFHQSSYMSTYTEIVTCGFQGVLRKKMVANINSNFEMEFSRQLLNVLNFLAQKPKYGQRVDDNALYLNNPDWAEAILTEFGVPQHN